MYVWLIQIDIFGYIFISCLYNRFLKFLNFISIIVIISNITITIPCVSVLSSIFDPLSSISQFVREHWFSFFSWNLLLLDFNGGRQWVNRVFRGNLR